MLRLLSFNMDYRWAHLEFVKSVSVWFISEMLKLGLTYHFETAIPMNSPQRSSNSHPLDSYNYVNYFTYVLYPPLYIAGPIMTFNDWLWQVRV